MRSGIIFEGVAFQCLLDLPNEASDSARCRGSIGRYG